MEENNAVPAPIEPATPAPAPVAPAPAPAPAPAAPTAEKPATGSSGGGRVLIVEDDKFLREMLVRKLFEAGFEVESAIDAPAAFALLGEKKPEVVLLDIMLPGEDGFSILGKIRADEATKELPVIILSNLGQQEDVTKALELGATDFMVKANFTIDEIIKKLHEFLSK